jgi:hypothetical protein
MIKKTHRDYREYKKIRSKNRPVSSYVTQTEPPADRSELSIYNKLHRLKDTLAKLGLADPGVYSKISGITRSAARRVLCCDYKSISNDFVSELLNKTKECSPRDIRNSQKAAISNGHIYFLKITSYMANEDNLEVFEVDLDEDETLSHYYSGIEEVLFCSMMYLSKHKDLAPLVSELLKFHKVNLNILQGFLLDDIARINLGGKNYFDKESIILVVNLVPEISIMLKDTMGGLTTFQEID